MDNIQKNLVEKAKKSMIGHFFIVNPPGRAKDPKKDLMRWTEQIVQEFFKSKNAQTSELKNNEDVLILDDELVNKKFYDKSVVDLVSKFLSHLPTRADRKFVVIEDLSKLSEIHNNKLLKIFEEPPVSSTIFLLNPSLVKVLPTIDSRAITIRAMVKQTALEQADLGAWRKKLEKKDMHQFCDFFKTRKEEEVSLAQALLDQIDPNSNAQLFRKAQKYLEAQAEDSKFNHNSYSRLARLREIYLEIEGQSSSLSNS
ncbi:MAG: hypothetical protein CME64_16545 [Halobacteriovoraceae bacterium]|nr:hypothetical protein [Halobacteriovoraceae bacterium]